MSRAVHLALLLTACAAAQEERTREAPVVLATSPLLPEDPGAPRAPDFRADALQPAGRVYTLAREGPATVLVFGASWCAPCMAELPELARLSARWAELDVDTVVIALDTTREAQAPILEQARGSALWVLDGSDQTVATTYGADTLPVVVLLDRHRHVRFLRMGADPRALATLARAVDDLHAE